MTLYLFVISTSVDQLNTSVQATMKTTPYELAFGQPPRNTIFPGTTGVLQEEDIQNLLDEGIMHDSANDLVCTCAPGPGV